MPAKRPKAAPKTIPRQVRRETIPAAPIPAVRIPLPSRIYFATSDLLFHTLQETLSASNRPAGRFGLGRALIVARGYDKVGLVRGAAGAPAAAMILEEAIASGAKEIVIFGSAAAFAPQLAPGDVIVPTEAIPADGTAPCYLPARARAMPNPALRDSIAGMLARSKVAFHEGRIASSDAVYFRPAAQILTIRRAKALAIDMELAALLAVARYRGVSAASVAVISAPAGGVPSEIATDRPAVLNAMVQTASALARWADEPAGPRG